MVWRSFVCAAAMAALLVGSGATALANDSSFGGSGANLRPIKETRVQMKAEDIVLELRQDDRVRDQAWFITATYQFHNPTKESVDLQMGFPELRCEEEEDCNGEGGRFRDLKITVDGKLVKHRQGKVTKNNDWGWRLGQVYLFDVSFKPGQTVEVVHRYTHDRSLSVEGESMEYLTTTGSLWNGPISQARFTLRTPWRPWMLTFLPEFELVKFEEKAAGGIGGMTEMIFEARKWTPKRNFEVFFPNVHNAASYFPAAAKDCPAFFDFIWNHKEDPEGTEKKIAAELAELSKATLRVCRNLPYAHHGYTFKSKDLQKTFYKDAVRKGYGIPYFPASKPRGEEPYEKLPWSYLTFAPNKSYSPALLRPIEQTWVKLVKAAEAK